jgi:hypothetical protein
MDKLPNKPTNLPWWASMGFPQPTPAADTDYADMGTAFGLDASLGKTPPATAPAAGDAGPAVDRLNRRSVI